LIAPEALKAEHDYKPFIAITAPKLADAAMLAKPGVFVLTTMRLHFER
jgi:hypothetical protein